MKKLIIPVFVAASVMAISSCGNSESTATAAQEVAQASQTSRAYAVNVSESSLGWKISKKLGPGHEGTVSIQEGTLNLENDTITAGKFVIDMNTITVTDLTEENGKSSLEAHLKGVRKPEETNDFFNVPAFPTSTFEITKATKKDASNYEIEGNLTIKDVTKNIVIPAEVTADENTVTANASFTVNRKDFGIKYGTTDLDPKLVADKIINDDIEFTLTLKGNVE